MNYNVNSDARIHTGLPNLTNANANARSGDVPIFLCPSDPSQAFTFTNAGRLNYGCSLGGASNYRGGTALDGIFAIAYPSNGSDMKGIAIAGVLDGTSNTAMFSEFLRGTFPAGSPGTTFDNTTSMIGGAYAGAALTDGRNVTECNNVSGTKIHYVGQQYYRNLPQNFVYTHTLPINWNKRVATGQKYNCGNTAFTAVHQASASYHSGGANVCMADGSVRFVTESIAFATWQAVGSRSGGETANIP